MYIWALFMDKRVETWMDEHAKKRTIANFMHFAVHRAHCTFTHACGRNLKAKKMGKSIDIQMSLQMKAKCFIFPFPWQNNNKNRLWTRILLISIVFTNFNTIIMLFMFFILFIFDRLILLLLRISHSLQLKNGRKMWKIRRKMVFGQPIMRNGEV